MKKTILAVSIMAVTSNVFAATATTAQLNTAVGKLKTAIIAGDNSVRAAIDTAIANINSKTATVDSTLKATDSVLLNTDASLKATDASLKATDASLKSADATLTANVAAANKAAQDALDAANNASVGPADQAVIEEAVTTAVQNALTPSACDWHDLGGQWAVYSKNPVVAHIKNYVAPSQYNSNSLKYNVPAYGNMFNLQVLKDMVPNYDFNNFQVEIDSVGFINMETHVNGMIMRTKGKMVFSDPNTCEVTLTVTREWQQEVATWTEIFYLPTITMKGSLTNGKSMVVGSANYDTKPLAYTNTNGDYVSSEMYNISTLTDTMKTESKGAFDSVPFSAVKL